MGENEHIPAARLLVDNGWMSSPTKEQLEAIKNRWIAGHPEMAKAKKALAEAEAALNESYSLNLEPEEFVAEVLMQQARVETATEDVRTIERRLGDDFRVGTSRFRQQPA